MEATSAYSDKVLVLVKTGEAVQDQVPIFDQHKTEVAINLRRQNQQKYLHQSSQTARTR
jgi:hypothetical protein